MKDDDNENIFDNEKEQFFKGLAKLVNIPTESSWSETRLSKFLLVVKEYIVSRSTSIIFSSQVRNETLIMTVKDTDTGLEKSMDIDTRLIYHHLCPSRLPIVVAESLIEVINMRRKANGLHKIDITKINGSRKYKA